VFSEKNLRSILYNLLSNALKYGHPDRAPRIRVACVPEGDDLVLTVQDNGLGLNGPQQKHLFQLFQRLHTHVEGSGLGLYMVKKIVENAGGTIEVQSQVNEGTTFTIRFPS
jgi:signal transduction histidine kinase